MSLKIQNKHIVYTLIFIITCVMLYSVVSGVIVGYSQTTPLLPSGLIFVFFHASLLHYGLNTIALLSLVPEIKHIRLWVFCLLIILSIGANIIAVGLLSTGLTVGLSGLFCGIIGYLAVDQYVTSKRAVFIVECLGMLVFTLFFPMVSIEGHLSGLIVGSTLALVYTFISRKRLKDIQHI